MAPRSGAMVRAGDRRDVLLSALAKRTVPACFRKPKRPAPAEAVHRSVLGVSESLARGRRGGVRGVLELRGQVLEAVQRRVHADQGELALDDGQVRLPDVADDPAE